MENEIKQLRRDMKLRDDKLQQMERQAQVRILLYKSPEFFYLVYLFKIFRDLLDLSTLECDFRVYIYCIEISYFNCMIGNG